MLLARSFSRTLAVVALALAGAAQASAPLPEKPDKYLADRAGVFDEARGHALNEKLAAFERATSNQVVVDVERKLPEGTTLEEFAHGVFRKWGIGQKGKSNGVLFLVFLDDRRMRIEVGYGLEGAVPDAVAHRITDEIVKPWFRRGDYARGIEAGVEAILAAAGGEAYRGAGRTVAEGRQRSGGLLDALPNDPRAVLLLLFFALLVPALFVFFVWRAFRSGASSSWTRTGSPGIAESGWTSSPSDSSSISSSSSDSSSSSSDFSGGGGDSGGGGSSDSW